MVNLQDDLACAQLKARRIVILGAAGFIGRWVARALCLLGVKPHLIVRRAGLARKVFLQYGIEGDIMEADLANESTVLHLIREVRPALTLNLVGYGVDPSERDEEQAYRINFGLVKSLAEAVVRWRDSSWPWQALVHIGSAQEYGAIGGDLSEDSFPNPTTVYGASKLAATRCLQELLPLYAVPGLTARLFTVYGPGEHPARLLPALIAGARSGGPIHLTSGNQERDFTFVGDVAEGLLRLITAPAQPGEVINLATGKLVSVRMFVEQAARVLGIPQELLHFGAIPTRLDEMRHDPVSVTRLSQLTDWRPSTGIAEGVRRAVIFEQRSNDAPEPLSVARCKPASQ